MAGTQGYEIFYYSFLNLLPQFNSCFSNNHLFTIVTKNDFRGNGQCILLNSFVEEVVDLIENGV